MKILKYFFKILILYNGFLATTSFSMNDWSIINYESFGAKRFQYKFDKAQDAKDLKPIKFQHFLSERQNQIKQKIRQEKEDRIFREYLASRNKSSFMTDFLTMRLNLFNKGELKHNFLKKYFLFIFIIK